MIDISTIIGVALIVFGVCVICIAFGFYMGRSGRRIKFIERLPLTTEKDVYEDLGPVDILTEDPYRDAMEE